MQGTEVGVVAAVLEDGEEFSGFFGGFDEGVGFGGGCGEGLFDDDWGGGLLVVGGLLCREQLGSTMFATPHGFLRELCMVVGARADDHKLDF